jgi:Mg-chelatase subunit ChlD
MKTPFLPLALFLLIALFLGLGFPALAQSPAIVFFIERADLAAFPRLKLYLSALDSGGKPVSGLVKEQFQVQEDHLTPILPDAVQTDSNAALQVVLVIDASEGMIGQPLQQAKMATIRFLDRLNENDRVALIALGGELDPALDKFREGREVDFGVPLQTYYQVLENLQAEGQTPLYLAAAKAVRLIARQPPGHRAVILLSDGWNEPEGQGSLEDVLRLAREERVPFYVIGFGRRLNLALLQRLAYESGGLFWAAPSASDLSRLYGDIAQALRSQLMLTYTSRLEADGKPHTVLITLQTAKGTVQTELQVELPALPTTPAPTVTPTLPPLIPTETNLPLLTQPTPPAAANPLAPYLVYLLAGGGFLLLAVLAFFLRRKPSPQWACARCGFALKDSDLTCPQCGETRKLPLRKG